MWPPETSFSISLGVDSILPFQLKSVSVSHGGYQKPQRNAVPKANLGLVSFLVLCRPLFEHSLRQLRLRRWSRDPFWWFHKIKIHRGWRGSEGWSGEELSWQAVSAIDFQGSWTPLVSSWAWAGKKYVSILVCLLAYIGRGKLVVLGVHLVEWGRRPCPLLGTDKEWVAICPGLLRTGCSLGPSLCSPFDQNGKLLIAEWKLWVLKNKKALLKVQVFLKACESEQAVEKNVCLTLTVLHTV